MKATTSSVDRRARSQRKFPSCPGRAPIRCSQRWAFLHAGRRNWTEIQDKDLVFPRPDGAPTNPDAFSQSFDRLLARSPLSRIRLHDLRHTHASILLKTGVPVKVVSERLGHANPAFTITVYQHIIPGMQADAATVFSNLVAGVLPPTVPASEVDDDE